MKKQMTCCMLLLALIAGVTRAASAPATTADDAVDQALLKEIGDVRTGLVDALNQRDWDKVLTYLDKDIVVTWANAEVSHGPAEVKAYCQKMMSGPNPIVASVTANPVVEGRKLYGPNVLISYGSLGDDFKLTDGTDFNLNSRFSSLLVKEDGKWLMKGFHASANVFDNPIQTLIVKKTAIWSCVIGAALGLVLGLLVARIFRRKSPA